MIFCIKINRGVYFFYFFYLLYSYNIQITASLIISGVTNDELKMFSIEELQAEFRHFFKLLCHSQTTDTFAKIMVKATATLYKEHENHSFT